MLTARWTFPALIAAIRDSRMAGEVAMSISPSRTTVAGGARRMVVMVPPAPRSVDSKVQTACAGESTPGGRDLTRPGGYGRGALLCQGANPPARGAAGTTPTGSPRGRTRLRAPDRGSCYRGRRCHSAWWACSYGAGAAHIRTRLAPGPRSAEPCTRSTEVTRAASRSQRRGPRSNGRRTSTCTCTACPPRTSPPSSASSSPLPGQPSRRTDPGCWACQRSR